MNKFFLTTFYLLVSLSLNAQIPELQINIGHSYAANSICFSPNGKYLASGSDDKTIKLWDVATAREIRTFSGHIYDVNQILFSPNGLNIFSCSDDKSIKIWDITKSIAINTLQGHKGKVTSISISPDGQYLLSGDSEGIAIIWDIKTGNEIRRITKQKKHVFSLQFSPNGKLFAIASLDKTIRIYDFEKAKEISTIKDFARSLHFTPDGNYLLGSTDDYALKLWDVQSGKEQKTYQAHSGEAVCFSTDGKKLLRAGWDKTFTVWDFEKDKELMTLSGHTERVNAVTFSSDGQYLASSSYDKSTKLWNANNGKEIKTFAGKVARIHSATFSPDGKSIVCDDGDKTIRIWDISHRKGFRNLVGHNRAVQSINFSSDGKYLASGSFDNSIKIWDANSGKEIKTLVGHTDYINSATISNDQKYIVSCSNDNTIKIWEINSGKELMTLSKKDGNVTSAHISPDGKFIAGGFRENDIVLWDGSNGKEIKTLSGHKSWIHSVNFSNDSKFLVSSSEDETVKIWNTGDGSLFKTITEMSSRAIFSPNNKYVVTCGIDKKIKIWDVQSGNLVKSLPELKDWVFNLSFSPDGKYLISGYFDGSVCIWNVEKGTEIVKLFGFGESDWIVVTPDGQFDGTPEGIKLLHFVKGMEIIPIEGLFEKFYTPNLLEMAIKETGIKNSEIDLNTISALSKIEIISPTNNSTVNVPELKIIVKTVDQGGGIDEIRLYHNGKLLDGTTRGFKSTGQNHEFTVTLTDGENRIKATAFNSQRTESIPDEIVVNYKAPQQVKPNMHILAVGINNYLNPKYNLNYAKNDADAFVQSLSTGASSLFGKVEVTTINDANATKTGILDAIEKIKATAKAEDVFVFYYAGHGVMSSGTGIEKPLFYLVPHDVTKMYEADEMLKKSGISATEIGEFSKTIKAQKQLFVIDACQSGGAMQTLAMRGAAEEKAIAQLARSTGTYFIAASGTEQFATEVAELGHGIFTYSVIEALKGTCKSQDGKVTVNLLKSCVEDLVPELSKKHKGQPQFPTGYGFGMDFPVVMVK